MKRRTILSSILLLSVAMLGGGVGEVNDASATLEYQEDVSVQFGFNETIGVTISGDLEIGELVPGNYAESDAITVGASTNSLYGYTLTATAGTSSTNTRLVNTASSAYYFTSLDTSASLTSMASASDNYWGYSYSTNSGSTWSNYSGLPQDSNASESEHGKGGKTLLNTTDNSAKVQFKIGAKASAAQALGEYTNTINFYAVANAS